jgi:8-oxo-dGTP pyrophosphatase MutT (NUDIX family)
VTTPATPGSGEGGSFRHLGDDLRYQGRIWSVVRADFEAPDGTRFERDVVRSPGAVGIVALEPDAAGRLAVVLVSQYRPVLDRYVCEIPAGMRDVPGEPPQETARRELAEEAGRQGGTWQHLLDIHPSPGMTDATTIIFAATDLMTVPTQAHGPEEEHLEILIRPLDEAIAEIATGRITDAKTVVGLLAARAAIDVGTLVVPGVS